MARLFQRDDSGVSELIGFILSFALSAVFLLIALGSFYTARENTDAVVTGVELKTIANRVAEHIVEAGLVSQEFPNATLNVTVALPQDLNGHPYYVEATPSAIYANTTDGTLSAQATTFKLDAVTGVSVNGRVYSSNEVLIVSYSLQNNGLTRDIRIHGE